MAVSLSASFDGSLAAETGSPQRNLAEAEMSKIQQLAHNRTPNPGDYP